MCRTAYETMRKIQELSQTDPEYLALEHHLLELELQFRGIMQTLPEDSRAAVMEYIGTCGELHFRLLEIACFCNNCDKM